MDMKIWIVTLITGQVITTSRQIKLLLLVKGYIELKPTIFITPSTVEQTIEEIRKQMPGKGVMLGRTNNVYMDIH